MFFILYKDLEKTFLDTSPLFHALLGGKLWGKVFNSDHIFSAGNNVRVTIVSERADNNNYHLPRCYHFICENLVLCRKGESKSFNSPFASHGLLPVIAHLVLVVIRLVTEGDLLFTFFLQYLSVGVVPRRNHRLSRPELLQTVPKPHQSKTCGVFGYPEATLKEIGMYHMMKESAVEKAKSRAVEKLREAYPGSRLQVWRAVHRMMRRPVLPSEEDSELRRNFPQYVRALAEVYAILEEAVANGERYLGENESSNTCEK